MKINRKKQRGQRRVRPTSLPILTPGPNRKERRAEPKRIRAYEKAKKIADWKNKNEKEGKKQKEEAKKLKVKRNERKSNSN